MTNHVGSEESSKLILLSCSVNLSICFSYPLFLNISFAFCLLNVQHIPRSVGYIEKMLEQFSLCPFQTQLFIIPGCYLNVISIFQLWIFYSFYHIPVRMMSHLAHQNRVAENTIVAQIDLDSSCPSQCSCKHPF